ncbi:hypothetical protein RYZ20_15505 [Thioclava sp. A2]|uniref:hypothetical protein n=1 Tax=Thioclava sp. FCG-A2 TaxID=3080562 RepID=UPI0029558302|nr:hypothetical protein [Thioclava sp. A2]MDV7272298.1 hypothetical protein [Thioclava sp. A2]
MRLPGWSGWRKHTVQTDRFGPWVPPVSVTCCAERLWPYLRGVPKCRHSLALESDYTTRTATIGAALSGVYDYDSYEFHPELAFSYGKTWIGNVGFTGTAYGLVDNTLSLDAGSVSIANLTFRPEVIIPMDATRTASFAPRLICEQVKTAVTREECGGGAEFGLNSTSEDELTNLSAKIIADRVGNSTRTGLQLNFEHRF